MRTCTKISFVICIVFSLLFFFGCDSPVEPEATPTGATGPFKVTYVSNGGSSITAANVQGGQAATKPTNPVKSDYSFEGADTSSPIETKYVFIGWYTDTALTSRFDFSTKINEDITLYAKWRPIAKSNIAFTPSGGSESVTYDKTEEIYAIDTNKTGTDITSIKGATPSFIEDSADAMEKGVFWAGRTVELSPFVMSRYEVTQKLYEDVMTGITFNNQTANSANYAIVKESNGTTDAAGASNYTITKTPSVCIVAANDPVYPVREGETANKRPVDNVTWYDAVYFCNKLSSILNLTPAYNISNITIVLDSDSTTDGHITNATVSLVSNANGYRLPTEAEWEFAARGGNTEIASWSYMFSGSDTESEKKYDSVQNKGLDTTGWYAFNTSTANGKTASTIPAVDDRDSWGTHETGKKDYNELGLFDMSGNVAEWCYDSPLYAIDRDPAGATSNSNRVVRGGSWFNNASAAVVSHREVRDPKAKAATVGFRIVRSVPATTN